MSNCLVDCLLTNKTLTLSWNIGSRIQKKNSVRLVELLVYAAERLSFSVTGTSSSAILWNCPFTVALAKIARYDTRPPELHSDTFSPQYEHNDAVLAENAPILALLMADWHILSVHHAADPISAKHLFMLRGHIFRLACGALMSKISSVHPTTTLNEISLSDIDELMGSLDHTTLRATSRRLRSCDPSQQKPCSSAVFIPTGGSLAVTLEISHDSSGSETATLRNLVRWLIRWDRGITLTQLLHSIERVVDNNLSIPDAGWNCHSDDDTETPHILRGAHVIYGRLPWLVFILEEVVRKFPEVKDEDEDGDTTVWILNIWSKTVIMLYELDVHDPGRTQYHQHSLKYPGSAMPDTDSCTALCRCYPVLIQLIELVPRPVLTDNSSGQIFDANTPFRLDHLLLQDQQSPDPSVTVPRRPYIPPSAVQRNPIRSTAVHCGEIKLKLVYAWRSLFNAVHVGSSTGGSRSTANT